MRFQRKNIRLPRAFYIGTQRYFFTSCTLGRLPRFQDGSLVAEVLNFMVEESRSHGFNLQAYCSCPTISICSPTVRSRQPTA
jgi:hypothetical protein